MKTSPLGALRLGVILLGAVDGVLLVRALDAGLAGEPRALDWRHAALGLASALALLPGPLLCLFVTPESSPKARGLAAGGATVTGLAAIFGGAFLYDPLFARGTGGTTHVLCFAWCALALPLSAVDFWRVGRGAPPPLG